MLLWEFVIFGNWQRLSPDEALSNNLTRLESIRVQHLQQEALVRQSLLCIFDEKTFLRPAPDRANVGDPTET